MSQDVAGWLLGQGWLCGLSRELLVWRAFAVDVASITKYFRQYQVAQYCASVFTWKWKLLSFVKMCSRLRIGILVLLFPWVVLMWKITAGYFWLGVPMVWYNVVYSWVRLHGITIAWYDVVFLGMIVWYYLSWNVLKRPPKPRSYSYHQLLTQTQDKWTRFNLIKSSACGRVIWTLLCI